MQAPTLDPKVTDPHCTFARASFLDKRGQQGTRESCILLEKGPTWTLVDRASKRSSLAVREFRTASEERCGRGYDRCVQTLLPDVVASETHWSSLCELKLWTFESPRKNFAWWAVTRRTEDLTNHRTVKIGGGGPLRGDERLHGTITCHISLKW